MVSCADCPPGSCPHWPLAQALSRIWGDLGTKITPGDLLHVAEKSAQERCMTTLERLRQMLAEEGRAHYRPKMGLRMAG